MLAVFFLTMLIIAIFVYPITNAAIMHAIARAYMGEPVTATEAIKHGFKRFLPLIGTSILVGLVVNIGFLLCLVPGVIFWVWFGLSQQVVVLEGTSGTTAMSRSKSLTVGDWRTFLALGFIIWVISFGINMSAKMIPEPYVQIVVASVLQAMTTVLWAAGLVVFYFSARCRVENFDLHFLAEAIGEEAPGEPTL